MVGVPESGNAAALGYSMESGIPYGTAFVKNSYVGRTFIKPKQSSRESACPGEAQCAKGGGGRKAGHHDRRFHCPGHHQRPDRAACCGMPGPRRCMCGVSAPPFLHPCYFGTDIPERGPAHRPRTALWRRSGRLSARIPWLICGWSGLSEMVGGKSPSAPPVSAEYIPSSRPRRTSGETRAVRSRIHGASGDV